MSSKKSGNVSKGNKSKSSDSTNKKEEKKIGNAVKVDIWYICIYIHIYLLEFYETNS